MVLVLVLGSCSQSREEPEAPTTVLTEPVPPSPDTTGYSDNPCFKFPVEVLKLHNDYREDVRTFAGADEAAYKRRARALVDEARSVGCPMPTGLSTFLS